MLLFNNDNRGIFLRNIVLTELLLSSHGNRYLSRVSTFLEQLCIAFRNLPATDATNTLLSDRQPS
jgi:hypothetical protein